MLLLEWLLSEWALIFYKKKKQVKRKLTYFSGRGLAEPIRLLLKEAGLDFEDVRVSDIKEMKPSLPFGQVPVYEEGDDFKISQSIAIARYVATETGLRGSTNQRAAFADMVVDGVNDLSRQYYMSTHGLQNENEKKEAQAAWAKDKLAPWIVHFERFLTDNGDYYIGEFSWADLVVFARIGDLYNKYPDPFLEAPKVKSHFERIRARPRIAAWLLTRPDSLF